jgi:hypothetical protein
MREPERESLWRFRDLQLQIGDAIESTVEERMLLGAALKSLLGECEGWPPYYVAIGDLLAASNTPYFDAAIKAYLKAARLDPSYLLARRRAIELRLDKMRMSYDRYGLETTLREARAATALEVSYYLDAGVGPRFPALPFASAQDDTLSLLASIVALPLRHPLPPAGSADARELAARLGIECEPLGQHFDNYRRILFLTGELLALERTDPKVYEDRQRFRSSAGEASCYLNALLNCDRPPETEVYLLHLVTQFDLGNLEGADSAVRLGMRNMPGGLRPYFMVPRYSGLFSKWTAAYREGNLRVADSLVTDYWRAIDPALLNPSRIRYWANVAHAIFLTRNPEGAWLDATGRAGRRYLERLGHQLGSATGLTICLMGPPSYGSREGTGLNGFVYQVLSYPEVEIRTGITQAPGDSPQFFRDGAMVFARALDREEMIAGSRGDPDVPHGDLYVHAVSYRGTLRVYGFLNTHGHASAGATAAIQLRDATGRAVVRSWSRRLDRDDLREISPEFAPGVMAPVVACNFEAAPGHYLLEVDVVGKDRTITQKRNVHIQETSPDKLTITGLEPAVRNSMRNDEVFLGRRFMPAPAFVPIADASGVIPAGMAPAAPKSTVTFLFETAGLIARNGQLRWHLDYVVLGERLFLESMARASAGRPRYEPPEILLARADLNGIPNVVQKMGTTQTAPARDGQTGMTHALEISAMSPGRNVLVIRIVDENARSEAYAYTDFTAVPENLYPELLVASSR